MSATPDSIRVLHVDAVHPEDRQEARTAVGTAMETGSFPTFEHRIQRPDGSIRWVQCRGEVSQEDGETSRITGTVLEITDRRSGERDSE